jgi:hypothetical protein
MPEIWMDPRADDGDVGPGVNEPSGFAQRNVSRANNEARSPLQKEVDGVAVVGRHGYLSSESRQIW